MFKIVNPGKVLIGKQRVNVFCKIEIKDWKLSISGVEGPLSSGNCRGSCGQIEPLKLDLSTLTPGWTVGKLATFNAIWERWHLNDMRPYCEHQYVLWELDKEHTKIEVIKLKWSDKFFKTMNRAKCGDLDAEEYRKYSKIYPIVDKLTTEIYRPKHHDCWGIEGEQMISAGWIEVGEKELKYRCWVHENERPEGILGKPCPICGYKYGSEWRKDELPAYVVGFLTDLPETTVKPDWV